jgi:hypothetical protein
MTATTIRVGAAQPPRQRGARPSYDGYVVGANALRIDPIVLDPYPDPPTQHADDAEPASAPLPVALPKASFIVLIASVLIAAVLGVLVLNTKINENSFTLDNLRSRQSSLDVQEQQVSQQLADLESTGNLSRLAAQLGLVPAGSPAFIVLPGGKVVGVPEPAHGPATGTGAAAAGDPGR